jgi:hypothetical protein
MGSNRKKYHDAKSDISENSVGVTGITLIKSSYHPLSLQGHSANI